jgi:hypothetical protein
MSERFANDLERELASCLEPLRAPASLWYRVDSALEAPRPARWHSLPRLALAFGLLLVATVSVGWYFDGRGRELPPVPQGAHRVQVGRAPAPGSSQHACVVCHV